MASKRRLRRNACDGKRQYPDYHQAFDSLQALRRLGKVSGRITVYKCKYCRSFHVGHTPADVIAYVKRRHRLTS